jgi:hypothetical protein
MWSSKAWASLTLWAGSTLFPEASLSVTWNLEPVLFSLLKSLCVLNDTNNRRLRHPWKSQAIQINRAHNHISSVWVISRSILCSYIIIYIVTYFNCGLVFFILRLELRAYTLSHSTSPFLWWASWSGLSNYLSGLPSNCSPPDLCLPSS